MVDVEVEFEYTAEQPDELTIKKGETIKNVLMVEGGWWEGELNGKKGMFPDNFVKVIKDPSKEVKKEEVKKEEVKKEEVKKEEVKVQASKRQSVKDLANKIKAHVPDGPGATRRKDSSGKKKRAKVLFSYEPENDDELKLDVGDIVEVIKQEEEGWCEGMLNGKTGVFPSNFVEVIEEDESVVAETAESEEASSKLIKGKKVKGVGLGNIFGDGPIKLRHTDGPAPVKGKRPSEKVQERKAPEQPVQRKSKDKVTVKVTDINLGHNIDRENSGDFVENLPVDFMQNYDSGFDYIEKVISSSDILEKYPCSFSGVDSHLNSDLQLKLASLTNNDSAEYQGINEEELIEYADVDISPDTNFNAQNISHESVTIVTNSVQTVQSYTPKRNNLSSNPTSHGDLPSPGIPQGIQSVLDDLDSCLDRSYGDVVNSESAVNAISDDIVAAATCVSNVPTEPGKHFETLINNPHVHPIANQLKKPTIVLDNKLVESGLGPHLGWHVEQTTPPYKIVHPPVDSVLLAKKRFQHSAEKHNYTPLRGESGDYRKRTVHSDTDDPLCQTADQQSGRRSVAFLPNEPEGESAKENCNSLCASSNPSTNYFSTLSESGNLSPFIKSIANKYNLFGKTISGEVQGSNDSMDRLHSSLADTDVSESYTSFLLGHSFDIKLDQIDNKSLEIVQAASSDHQLIENNSSDMIGAASEGGNTMPLSTVANAMLTNYVYEVLTGDSKRDIVDIDSVPSFMTGQNVSDVESSSNLDKSEDFYTDTVLGTCYSAVHSEGDESMAVCVDDASSRFCDTSCKDLSGEGETDSFDSELELDGILLCMTREDDDSPPLSSCSPSLYPVAAQSTPYKVKKPEGHTVTKMVAQFENPDSSISADNLHRNSSPLSVQKSLLSKQYCEVIEGHTAYFKGPKLPDGGELRQSSSYCRIPFGSTEAPPFWFKKDFNESPKQNIATNPQAGRIRKLRLLKFPSLFSLAEKAHMNNFKKRLDNIVGKHKYGFTDQDSMPIDPASVFFFDRSPAKKRRRKDIHEIESNKNSDGAYTGVKSLFLPVLDDWGSVESYFAGLIADVPDSDKDPIASPGNINLKHEVLDSSVLPKMDWSAKLFGTDVNELAHQNKLHVQTASNGPLISPVPLKVLCDKSHRLYSIDRASDLATECSEKRRKMPFISKPLNKSQVSSLIGDSVKLTSFRKLVSDNAKDDPFSETSDNEQHFQNNKINNCMYRPQSVCDNSNHLKNHSVVPSETADVDEKTTDNAITSTMKNIFSTDEDQSLFKYFFNNEDSLEQNETKGLMHCDKLAITDKLNLDQIDTSYDSQTADYCDVTRSYVDAQGKKLNAVEPSEIEQSVFSKKTSNLAGYAENNTYCTPETKEKVQFRCSASSASGDGGELDELSNREDNVFDLTPDPDTLLKDLKGLDLSGTPQYASDSIVDGEIHKFLSEAFEPFDDILMDSFTSPTESPTKGETSQDPPPKESHKSTDKVEIIDGCDADVCRWCGKMGECSDSEHWSLYPKCSVHDSETQTDFGEDQTACSASNLYEDEETFEEKLDRLRKWYHPEVYPSHHEKLFPCYQTEESINKSELAEYNGVEYDAPEAENSAKIDLDRSAERYYNSSPEILHYINTRMKNFGLVDINSNNSARPDADFEYASSTDSDSTEEPRSKKKSNYMEDQPHTIHVLEDESIFSNCHNNPREGVSGLNAQIAPNCSLEPVDIYSLIPNSDVLSPQCCSASQDCSETSLMATSTNLIPHESKESSFELDI